MKKSLIIFIAFALIAISQGTGLYASNGESASISIPHQEVLPGTTVDVPVTVTGFTEFNILQIRITFNNNVIDVDMDQDNFVTNIHPLIGNLQFGLFNDTTIALSWFRHDPRTIPDGEKLFDLHLPFCMDEVACALHDNTSLLDFVEEHTFLVRLVNDEMEFIPLTLNNGSVFAETGNYALVIHTSGDGQVTVDGSIYTEPLMVEPNTTLTLEAMPDEGWSFDGWTGSLTGTDSPIDLLMDQSKEVGATFTKIPVPYTFTLDIEGQGTVNVNGEPYTGAMTVDEGTVLSLEAIADPGYQFEQWTTEDGDTISGQTTFQYTMPDQDITLTAHFKEISPDSHTLSLLVNPADAGGVQGAGEYEAGEEVTVSATANEGYLFLNWTGPGNMEVSDNTQYTFAMPDNDLTLTANFSLITYTISAGPNEPDFGSVTGAGEYGHGEEVTLTAIPAEGYHLVNWTEEGIVVFTDAVYVFTATDNRELVANFDVTGYTVNVSVLPEGAGTVTGAGSYNPGDNVTLEATANEGYEFVNWTDTGGEEMDPNAQYTFDMPANDLILTANFSLITYTISAGPNEPDFGSVTGTGEYAHGEEVTLTAIPAEGYHFVNWTEEGDEVFTNEVYVFTATDNRELVANFERNTYTITAHPNPADGGTVNGASQFSETFVHGEEVTLIAAANPGFDFWGWVEGSAYIEDAGAEYTFIAAGDRQLVANFDAESVFISASSMPEDGGTITGDGIYSIGGEVTLTAIPAEGYHFVNWTEEGIVVFTDAVYVFTATGDRELVANFTLSDYTVSVSVLPEGAGTITGEGNYNFGDDVILEATANEGYEFVNWTDTGGEEMDANAQYTFAMPANDLILNANFAMKSYTISAGPNEPDFGSVTGTGEYAHGEEVTLTAIPAEGYHFVNWTEEGDEVFTNEVYVFTAAGDRELVANFTLSDYTVSVSVLPEGAGTITGEGNYNFGDDVTLEATANEGYEFVNWTDTGGEEMTASTQYTFNMPAGDVSLIANFEALSHVINVVVQPDGAGTVTGGGTYDHGVEVVLEAAPATGYHFTEWTENDTVIGGEPLLTFVAESDRMITASFQTKTFTIAASAGDGGSIDPAGEVSVEYGAEQTFTIEPDEGYRVADILVDGQSVGPVESYTFDHVVADHTIHAGFETTTFAVTFNVNMTYVTYDHAGFDFDPDNDVVYLAGNMIEDWITPGDDPESQEMSPDGDHPMVYTKTLQLEAGTYAYRYFLNEGWDGDENEDAPDREIEVSGDMAVHDWFGSMSDPTEVQLPEASLLINAFPVPARNYVTVTSNAVMSEIRVVDMLGKHMITRTVDDDHYELNVTGLRNGTYFIRVTTNNGVKTIPVKIIR